MIQPLRTLLLGFGKISAGYANELGTNDAFPYSTHVQVLNDHKSFELRAVVDPSEDARRLGQKWGVPLFYSSLEEIDNLREFDVLIIATPPTVREGIVSRFQNLKGLLLEKPIGLCTQRALLLCEEISRFTFKTQVNYLRRADSLTRKLAQGGIFDEIGDLQAITAIYGNGLKNNGSHIIDLARMLVGEVEVAQALGPPLNYETAFQDDINVPFSLKFKNGCLMTAQPVSFKHYRENAVQFWGTKGRLEYGHGGFTVLKTGLTQNRMISEEKELTLECQIPLPSTVGKALFEMYSNLAQAVHCNEPVWSSLDSAMKTQRVVDAVMQSVKDGGGAVQLKTDCLD